MPLLSHLALWEEEYHCQPMNSVELFSLYNIFTSRHIFVKWDKDTDNRACTDYTEMYKFIGKELGENAPAARGKRRQNSRIPLPISLHLSVFAAFLPLK